LSGFGFIRGCGSRDIETARSLAGDFDRRRTNRWRQSVVARAASDPVGAPVSPNLGNAAWTALGVLIAATVTSCIGSGERSAALPLQSCRRTFNALTKTPLANLRMKDKWAAQTEP